MSARRSRSFIFVATAFLAAASAGCQASADSDRVSEGDVSPNSVDEMRVPLTAEIAVQGRGDLKHTVRRDGRIWLVDATAEKTLFTVPVSRGQRFIVAPNEDRASLDGLDVFAGDMHTRNEHRIYYLPKR